MKDDPVDLLRRTPIPAVVAEDVNMSLAAKGLFAYMFGEYQYGEKISVRDMAIEFRETETRINELIGELDELGYMDRERFGL